MGTTLRSYGYLIQSVFWMNGQLTDWLSAKTELPIDLPQVWGWTHWNQSPQKQQLNELRNIMIIYPSYKSKVFKWNKSGLDEENRVTSNIKDDKSFGCSRFDVKWKFKESHRFR